MFEAVRQYAIEQLSGHGELAAVQQRHAAFILTLAERAAARLCGPPRKAFGSTA